MAMKDYKKKGKDFWQSKDEENQVYINKTATKYVVIASLGFPRNPKIIKTFKTKSQALKFAKSYMRTH